jgi:hypothetical protein
VKTLLLVLTLLVTGSAWAEWVMYSTTATDTFYYDPATIRKDGNIRRVWQLENWGKRGTGGEISRRYRTEYDCKQERYKLLGFSIHSEPMAGGTVLLTGGEDYRWEAIAPDTVAAIALNIVCAK